jgi:mannose/fructose/N-acetylgalactosamine-specific phosphotransferase system component IID
LNKKGKIKQDNGITKFDLFKVFLASFFMQAVWNFKSLISIGFSICFFPVLGKLCDTPEAKREFFQRHLKFFNAHPYFASFALGVSIRLEELRKDGEANIPKSINNLKDLLVGPLGAVGDRLFWATIKPASLVLGMVGILISPSISLKLVSLIIVFLIYNIPHFYYRYEGILEGYQHPTDIYKYIGQERFEILRRFFTYLLIVSLILLIFFYSYQLYKINPNLMIIFVLSALYAKLISRFTNNFYLMSLASFIFFVITGILFL